MERPRHRRRSIAAVVAIVAGGLALGGLPAAASAAPAGSAPALQVDGNWIRDANGRGVTLQGVSVLAPEQNDVCDYCDSKPTAELIDLAADASAGWFSDVVRLPVTEISSTTDLAAYDAQYIAPYVDQAVDLGIYLIIDLHLVRDYGDGPGAVPQSMVKRFWDYIAPIYGSTTNVIFEVFNEPINPANWNTWKDYIQPVVDSIRTVAPDTLLLMGSPQWSTMLNGALANPVDDDNLAYVYHLYPNQGSPTPTLLDGKFGNAANTVPVVLTEFGWNPPGEFSDPITNGTTSNWGVPFREYMDAHPWIGWQAWILDNFWKPQMFDYEWNLMGGEFQGRFIKDWLAGAPNVSPCESHDAVGAAAQVSSVHQSFSGDNLTDGDCSDAGRWLSAVGDTTPTATVTLGSAQTVDSVGVYSGYGGGSGVVLVDFTLEVHTGGEWQQVASITGNTQPALDVPVGVAGVDQVRLVVTDPSASTTEAEIARVYELAVRG
ncbi:glycoside hydrolase family 5 protein [Labedella phragmitis]|uniref:cellulase n=1 Tax=Labedella phragmitis TaxID=2498849 RepID=A0A3S3Z0Z8_9MICO|nr:glycoside hydrolase family 5 protein [Labedella phragmitis]RWZ46208.1 glycoside hydrolase family 5 protein [Labedella phragmitis]